MMLNSNSSHLLDESTRKTTRELESTAVNTFSLTDEPPVFVRGKGATLWTKDGSSCVDLVCGSAVSNYGHGVNWQQNTAERAMATGILHTGTRLPSPFRADFYAELYSILPTELGTVHLSNSGSEAVETALKAAQFTTGKSGVISFHGAYHGRTSGALAVTGSRKAREGFDIRPFDVQFMPYPYTMYPPMPSGSADELSELCLKLVESTLRCPVAGVQAGTLIVEAVQGVSGVVIPPPEFLQGLRRLCDEYDVIMIVDEVWNGFGRCGRWFGFEIAGIVPDIVVFGKAASSSLPLAGVAAKPHILRKWQPGSHTSTFQGNPIACAIAAENIRQMKAIGLLERCNSWLAPRLSEIGSKASEIKGVGEYRTVGAQLGIELIDSSGQPDSDRLKATQRAAQNRGALLYGGGWYSNVLILVPPLTISEEELLRAERCVIGALEETA
jgi:4-aminobutyrate aminotransferase-like enzyme